MFDFGNLNENQKQAVLTTDGPLLLIAGPGTGKTFTLVKRIAYLIKEKNVSPDRIMAVTFTEKAARELSDRIAKEFSDQEIDGSVNDMYIGTFHALCLRIMKEYGCDAGEKPPRLMDRFDQVYRVAAKMDTLGRLPGIGDVIKVKDRWEKAKEMCRYVNQLHEELVNTEKLMQEDHKILYTLGRLDRSYRYHILQKHNLMDFSTLLTDTYRLLQTNRQALNELREKLRYILVDEYQDTNYIQEQLVFLLAGDRKNICVVGDDDQGMYRFRGATIRNIFEFPSHFEPGECRQIRIETNYRSAPGIIDFYNTWMRNSGGVNLFNWDRFRFDKTIRPFAPQTRNPVSVFAAWRDDAKEEAALIAKTVRNMKDSGTITDYNQVVCLFRSVKSTEALIAAKQFETAGIPVYSPRSAMFFDREEIRLTVGALLLCFPAYLIEVKLGSVVDESLRNYFLGCVSSLKPYITADPGLHDFLTETGGRLAAANDENGLSLIDVFYRLFAYKPFREFLQPKNNVYEDHAMRNLSALSRLLSRFSSFYDLHTVTGKNISYFSKHFFGVYLKYLIIDGIGEYESEEEAAPAGCVTFMTIH